MLSRDLSDNSTTLKFEEKVDETDKTFDEIYLETFKNLMEKISKFGGIKKISYFCNRVMSERKRTGTMKALVNERIERYLAIDMWKFQSLLTINRQ